MLNLTFCRQAVNFESKVDSFNPKVTKLTLELFSNNLSPDIKCELSLLIEWRIFSYFKYSFGQQLSNSQVIAKFQVNQCRIFQHFENVSYSDQ